MHVQENTCTLEIFEYFPPVSIKTRQCHLIIRQELNCLYKRMIKLPVSLSIYHFNVFDDLTLDVKTANIGFIAMCAARSLPAGTKSGLVKKVSCQAQDWDYHVTHYSDVIMSAIPSQITDVWIVCSTVCFRRRSKKASKLRATGL